MSRKNSSALKRTTSIPAGHIGWTGRHFLTIAFKDYVGSRVMLNNDLPLQGVVLASTCIEKYLKAILSSVGKRTPTHLDSLDFLAVMKANGVGVSSYISESFLDYLGRAYEFRYIEPTTGPVSIGVERRKLLAELDYSVQQFEASMVVRNADGSTVDSDYKRAVDARDQRVWLDNYLLNSRDKTAFIEDPAPLYGAFATPLHEFVEITHPRFKATNNAKFEHPTFVASGSTISMEFGESVDGRFV